MDPNAVRKESNTKSTLYLLLGVVLIVAAIAAVAYAFATNPDLVQNTVTVIVVLLIAILVIGIAIAIIAFFVAIPYYARGREIQTDMAYDIDDVKEVDGKMVEEEKK
ncbi:MAG: hypothetical protein IJT54_02010 [Candidatus Methanomethylophilaceae archaeon]|nr:hypothetical protein [Candidatus Methanomethylophilaceae archaeon]